MTTYYQTDYFKYLEALYKGKYKDDSYMNKEKWGTYLDEIKINDSETADKIKREKELAIQKEKETADNIKREKELAIQKEKETADNIKREKELADKIKHEKELADKIKHEKELADKIKRESEDPIAIQKKKKILDTYDSQPDTTYNLINDYADYAKTHMPTITEKMIEYALTELEYNLTTDIDSWISHSNKYTSDEKKSLHSKLSKHMSTLDNSLKFLDKYKDSYLKEYFFEYYNSLYNSGYEGRPKKKSIELNCDVRLLLANPSSVYIRDCYVKHIRPFIHMYVDYKNKKIDYSEYISNFSNIISSKKLSTDLMKRIDNILDEKEEEEEEKTNIPTEDGDYMVGGDEEEKDIEKIKVSIKNLLEKNNIYRSINKQQIIKLFNVSNLNLNNEMQRSSNTIVMLQQIISFLNSNKDENEKQLFNNNNTNVFSCIEKIKKLINSKTDNIQDFITLFNTDEYIKNTLLPFLKIDITIITNITEKLPFILIIFYFFSAANRKFENESSLSFPLFDTDIMICHDKMNMLFKNKKYPYPLDPRQFLTVNRFTKFKNKDDKACFLFHGVGTGKTITSLSIAISHLKEENLFSNKDELNKNNKKPLELLIVCPQGLFTTSFIKDCENLSIYTYNLRRYTILVNNIEYIFEKYDACIKNDDDTIYKMSLTGFDYLNIVKENAIVQITKKYNVLICDEAHKIITERLSPPSDAGYEINLINNSKENAPIGITNKMMLVSNNSKIPVKNNVIIQDYRFFEFVKNITNYSIFLTGTPIQGSFNDVMIITYFLNLKEINPSNNSTFCENINSEVKVGSPFTYFNTRYSKESSKGLINISDKMATSTFYYASSLTSNLKAKSLDSMISIDTKKEEKKGEKKEEILPKKFIDIINGERNKQYKPEPPSGPSPSPQYQPSPSPPYEYESSSPTSSSANINQDVSKLHLGGGNNEFDLVPQNTTLYSIIGNIKSNISKNVTVNTDQIIHAISNDTNIKPEKINNIISYFKNIITNQKGTPDIVTLLNDPDIGVALQRSLGMDVGTSYNVNNMEGGNKKKTRKRSLLKKDRNKTNSNKGGGNEENYALLYKELPFYFKIEIYNFKLTIPKQKDVLLNEFIDNILNINAIENNIFADKNNKEYFLNYLHRIIVLDHFKPKTTQTVVIEVVTGGDDIIKQLIKTEIGMLIDKINDVLLNVNGTSGKNFGAVILTLIWSSCNSLSTKAVDFIKYFPIHTIIDFCLGIVSETIKTIINLISTDYKMDRIIKHILPFISIYNYDYIETAIDQPSFYSKDLNITKKFVIKQSINASGNTFSFPKKHIENIYYNFSATQLDKLMNYIDVDIKKYFNLSSSTIDLSDSKNAELTYKINKDLINISCNIYDFNKDSEIYKILRKKYIEETADKLGKIFKKIPTNFNQLGGDYNDDLYIDFLDGSVTYSSKDKKTTNIIPVNITNNISFVNSPINNINKNNQTNGIKLLLDKLINPINEKNENMTKFLIEKVEYVNEKYENTLKMLKIIRSGYIYHSNEIRNLNDLYADAKSNTKIATIAASVVAAASTVSQVEMLPVIAASSATNALGLGYTIGAAAGAGYVIAGVAGLVTPIALPIGGAIGLAAATVGTVGVLAGIGNYTPVLYKNYLSSNLSFEPNFRFHSHYVIKDNQIEYFLPIIYPPTIEIMYDFCDFLYKKNMKYIWMNKDDNLNIISDSYKYGSSLTFPIRDFDDNTSIEEHPICIIISPNHKEGFSFIYNPVLISLGLSNTSGDEEQIYGRILRKYSSAGKKGKYDKKIYQYFSGGSSYSDNVISNLAPLYALDGETRFRGMYDKLGYDNTKSLSVYLPKPVKDMYDNVKLNFMKNVGNKDNIIYSFFGIESKEAYVIRKLGIMRKKNDITREQYDEYMNASEDKKDDLYKTLIQTTITPQDKENINKLIKSYDSLYDINTIQDELQLKLLFNVKQLNLSFFKKIAIMEGSTQPTYFTSALQYVIPSYYGKEFKPLDNIKILENKQNKIKYCFNNIVAIDKYGNKIELRSPITCKNLGIDDEKELEPPLVQEYPDPDPNFGISGLENFGGKNKNKITRKKRQLIKYVNKNTKTKRRINNKNKLKK
jgi:hypothetical protein